MFDRNTVIILGAGSSYCHGYPLGVDLRQKIMNLSEFLKNYNLTQNAADHFSSILNFKIDVNLPQRKLVDLGKSLSRVIAANHVIDVGTKGFRSDLISDSLETIKHEISMLVSSYKFQTDVTPIEEYKDDSNWLAFC